MSKLVVIEKVGYGAVGRYAEALTKACVSNKFNSKELDSLKTEAIKAINLAKKS